MSDLNRRVVMWALPWCLVGLTACGSLMDSGRELAIALTPYKVEIVQGNFVSREQVELLKPGLTRAQIKDFLGAPLVASLFHESRWDYVFSFRRQGQPEQLRRLTLFFKDDRLERFEGDPMPSEAEFVASLQGKGTGRKVPVLEASDADLAVVSPPRVSKKAEPVPAQSLPPTPYPPLETPVR